MDIKCAYLNGVLDEEVYMCQPNGYEAPGKETWVWKLKKALYGLKQGGCEWYAVIDNFFIHELGFTHTHANHCIYIFQCTDSVIIIPIYVDDLMLGYQKEADMIWVCTKLKKHFEMVDLGDLTWVVGMQVRYDLERGQITVDQSQYLQKVLAQFGMHESNAVSTPLPGKLVLCAATDTEVEEVWEFPYLETIGSLMYAMMGTCPDIAYAISTLSRFATCPGSQHISTMKHLFHKGMTHLGITFSQDGGELTAYSDSDYAADPSTHKSISGAIFTLAGGPISWSSKEQTLISLSTTEVEYVATAKACKEIIWFLHRLLHELGQDPTNPTNLFIDNHGTLLLAKNPMNHSHTKHIDVWHHFIQQCIAMKSVDAQQIPTANNPTDICTKSLGKQKIWHFRNLIGLSHVHLQFNLAATCGDRP